MSAPTWHVKLGAKRVDAPAHAFMRADSAVCGLKMTPGAVAGEGVERCSRCLAATRRAAAMLAKVPT